MLSVHVSTALHWRRRGMHIAMSSEVLQQLDLAQCTLRQDLLAEDIRDLLDRNTLVGLLVGCGTTHR